MHHPLREKKGKSMLELRMNKIARSNFMGKIQERISLQPEMNLFFSHRKAQKET